MLGDGSGMVTPGFMDGHTHFVDGGFRLGEEMRIAGDVTTYRHAYSDLAPSTDWSQTRASLRLEWTIGRDPGEGDIRGGDSPEGGS